jgi:hypothetical protein
LWISGLAALALWALAGAIVLWPPGDNVDAKALGEFMAILPGGAAVMLSAVWVILAAIHWL